MRTATSGMQRIARRLVLAPACESVSCVGDVVDRLVDQLDDVIIVEVVHHVASIALAGHESEIAQYPQLVRCGRLLESGVGGEIDHGCTAVAKSTQDQHATWCGERVHDRSDLSSYLGVDRGSRMAVCVVAHACYRTGHMNGYSYISDVSPLRSGVFRRLFGAQLIALVGTGLTTVALGLLAVDIAGDDAGVVLGTALAIKMIAYVTIAPVVTALVKHLPRRGVLVSADIVRCSAVVALPFIDSPWHVYALVALMQAAAAVFTPTFQATIPAVLPDEATYTRALSLSRLAYDLEALLSPIAAGVLLTVVSFHSLFVGTAIGFACSAVLVLSTTLPTVVATEDDVRSIGHRITIGMRRFMQVTELRALLALNLVVACITSFVIVNTPVLVRAVFDRSNADVAIMLAAYGAGSMLVALTLPRVLDRTTDRVVMLSAACTVAPILAGTYAALTLLNVDAQWYVLLGLWVLAGAATSAILTPTGRLLRRATTDAERPAVFAAQFSLSHLCFLVTYPLAGVVGAVWSPAAAVASLAIIAAGSTIVAMRAWTTDQTAPT